jgi:hypothetical protein
MYELRAYMLICLLLPQALATGNMTRPATMALNAGRQGSSIMVKHST